MEIISMIHIYEAVSNSIQSNLKNKNVFLSYMYV